MNSVRFDSRLYFSLKIPLAPQKAFQRLLRVCDVNWRVWSARRIVGDLQQSRIRKSLFGSRKLIHSEVDGRLKNKKDSDACWLGSNLDLHIVEAARALQRLDGGIDLCLGELLILLLHEQGQQGPHVHLGMPGKFYRRYVLSVIGGQDLFGLLRRLGRLRIFGRRSRLPRRNRWAKQEGEQKRECETTTREAQSKHNPV